MLTSFLYSSLILHPSSLLRDAVRDLFSRYFALVMATGIVSLAAHFTGWPDIAYALFLLNNVFYVVLWCLLLARVFLFAGAVVRDLTSHQRGPGFLTIVAGTCVLGTQHEVLAGQHVIAQGLWFLGIGLWFALTYAFFTGVIIREDKPPLAEGLSGTWLLAAVATQSVSVLGTVLAPYFGSGREVVLFFTLCLYLLGGMLYLFIIILIFYRLTFFTVSADDLTPTYWINMGAVAITTLAGARLLQRSEEWHLLAELRHFLAGFTLFFWATATWWLPLLLALGGWRHLVRRTALTYHPAYWAAVFPIGMYTASTYQLAQALDLPFLLLIPHYFIYVALATWAVVFAGMLASLGRDFRDAARRHAQAGTAARS
ncbi:MAG TPA: tellurite resistance/C4-dicarboxylate transporter family protein [Gemmataceae bacterium]|nr:tellurite resistance/C4-dicarboxylate transporter family protein [Gemmataceae bacterium]